MIMEALLSHKTMEKDLLMKLPNNTKNSKQWFLSCQTFKLMMKMSKISLWGQLFRKMQQLSLQKINTSSST